MAAVGAGRLTPRELEVLALIASGMTSPEIAETLSLSPETVRTHSRNLLSALGARTRAQAVAIGLRNGHLDL
jgi:DNA-binding CsgD family transcriptional regulator